MAKPLKPNYYFIRDFTKEKRRRKYIRRMQICDFISRYKLQYPSSSHFREKDLKKMVPFWFYDVIPPSLPELTSIRIPTIAWYIHNKITVQHPIWNGSFIQGIAQCGKIHYSKSHDFNSLTSYTVKRLAYVLKFCPFGTNTSENDRHNGACWPSIPALHLKGDKLSNSFMAGVFAMGQEYTDKEGNVYARYNKGCKKWLVKWGIPIEKEVKGEYPGFLISPFWPSLFHDWMPKALRSWRRIPKAYMAHEYSGIMWKVYTLKEFETNGIPYLKIRAYYSERYFTPEERLTKTMHRLWVDKGLTNIDERIKDVVRNHAPKTV